MYFTIIAYINTFYFLTYTIRAYELALGGWVVGWQAGGVGVGLGVKFYDPFVNISYNSNLFEPFKLLA